MTKSLEYEDEIFQQFIQSSDCIFQFTPLHYPNLNQQKLINSYFQVQSIIQEYQTANHIQKQIKTLNDQTICQGLLYNMIKDSNTIPFNYDLIKILGVQISQMLLDQFHQILQLHYPYLKLSPMQNIRIIMVQLLQDHKEYAYDCFLTYLRNLSLYQYHLEFKPSLIQTLLKVKDVILTIPIFGILVFLKLLEYISSETYHYHSSVDELMIVQFMEKIWDTHFTQLMTLGRELILKLDSPTKRLSQEILKMFQKFEKDLQDKVYQAQPYYMALFQNITLEPEKYRYNYIITLPVEVEKKLKYMIAESFSFTMIKEQFKIFFLQYGTDGIFLQSIIRYLVCLIDFPDDQVIQGQVLYALYDYAIDKRTLYKQAIFFDWLFYDQHNIKGGCALLQILFEQQNYELLHEFLWYILQSAQVFLEKNREWIVQNVNNSLRQWKSYDKVQRDPNIHQLIKQKFQYEIIEEENVPIQQEEEEEYDPGDIESIYPEEQQLQLGNHEFLPSLVNFIKSKNLQNLFYYPDQRILVKQFMNELSGHLTQMQSEPEYLDEEVAKLFYELYRGHFQDFLNKYDWNILCLILGESQQNKFWVKVIKKLVSLNKNVKFELLLVSSMDEYVNAGCRILKDFDNFEECLLSLFILQSQRQYDQFLQRLLNRDELNFILNDNVNVWNIILQTFSDEQMDHIKQYSEFNILMKQSLGQFMIKLLQYSDKRQQNVFWILEQNIKKCITNEKEQNQIIQDCVMHVCQYFEENIVESELQKYLTNFVNLVKESLNRISNQELANVLNQLFRFRIENSQHLSLILNQLQRYDKLVLGMKLLIEGFKSFDEKTRNCLDILSKWQEENDGRFHSKMLVNALKQVLISKIQELRIKDNYISLIEN